MDRGNKLYTSHRIILPEFRRRLLETTEEETAKPPLDVEAQAEIEQRINAAVVTGDIVRVMVYTDPSMSVYGLELLRR
ncbi:MAG: hypothetical protein ACYC2T_08240 [Bacillota bacterium]